MKKTLFLAIAIASISFNKQGTAQTVSTLAGSGFAGFFNGTGAGANFNSPSGVCADVVGNIYVADQVNHRIRKITPAGVVTTFAGSGSIGSTNATGIAASFNYPDGVCIDGMGNLYVTDTQNNKIRKITSAGVVTTFAGSGASGSVDAIGISASFNLPSGICSDAVGNIYVSDCGNQKIRKITPSGSVSTLAGSGTSGSINGLGVLASFNSPRGICCDASNNIYVADGSNNKIRLITPAGLVSNFAGSGSIGSLDAISASASFNNPEGVCVDASNNVYVADWGNHKVRKINTSGLVSTYAGSGTMGSTDAIGVLASFKFLTGIPNKKWTKNS